MLSATAEKLVPERDRLCLELGRATVAEKRSPRARAA